jgi:peroxiredoxin
MRFAVIGASAFIFVRELPKFQKRELSMQSKILTIGLCILGSILTAEVGRSGEPTGPKLGVKAPSFTLKDQNGKDRSLDEFLKKDKVALVFYRSASWCPFCQKQLIQLQADLKEIEASGVQVIGISYDSFDVLAKFAGSHKIAFPLLSDPDHKVISAYGLLNKEAKGKAEGIPYPGTIVLDRTGVIRAKLFLEGYRDRHSAKDLIKAVKEVP